MGSERADPQTGTLRKTSISKIGSMAAELDYAFLAEFAKTERGTITAIGASFTEVGAMSFPSTIDVTIAGRVRRPVDTSEPIVRLEVFDVDSPERTQLDIEYQLEDELDAVQYDGKVGSVFAANAPIFLRKPGLVVINIYVNDELARRLAFEAVKHDEE